MDDPKTLVALSFKSPEEVEIFGLRGSDIQWIRPQNTEDEPVSPDEWGLTDALEDGTCKYCQLLLHPAAPAITVHQPNLISLIESDCKVCALVEVSIARGSPDVVRRFRQGDFAYCSRDSATSQVTIKLEAKPKYTRAVATVGRRFELADTGVALNLSSQRRLGALSGRRFWTDLRREQVQGTSVDRLPIVKFWLDECRSSHNHCPTGEKKLPTRLLDLAGSPNVPTSLDEICIKLYETGTNETGQYVAVSYCWGDDELTQRCRTTRQNIHEYRDKIDFTSLPLLQREAILATLYLGIRYLWIDSLCIIQDDSKDWECEARTMNTVYSNASLTLAATSSQSPKDGLLHPFLKAHTLDIYDDTAFVRFETHVQIDDDSEPLNRRAWTFQEALFSPRTIHFGKEQWLWKCNSRCTSEDGLKDQLLSSTTVANAWYRSMSNCGTGESQLYARNWLKLMATYSSRDLTFRSDKLKAIAGLAVAFAQRTGFEFIAGVWAEDIANGLMWQATSKGVIRETTSLVPSWSWASVTGAVIFLDCSDSWRVSTRLLGVQQVWAGEHITSDLRAASLLIEGKLIRVRVGKQSLTQTLRWHLVKESQDYELCGEAQLDNLDSIPESTQDLFCLIVYLSSSENRDHFGLLLKPDLEGSPRSGAVAYRRLGLAIIWHKACQDMEDVNTTPVTLV